MVTLPAELQMAPAPLVQARVVIGGGAPRPAERSRRLRADNTENVVFGEFAGRPEMRGVPLLLDDICRALLREPLRRGDIGLPTDCMDCRTGLGGRRSGVEDINGEECLFFGDAERSKEAPMEVPQCGVFTVLDPSTVETVETITLVPGCRTKISLVPGCRTSVSCPLLAATATPSQASS